MSVYVSVCYFESVCLFVCLFGVRVSVFVCVFICVCALACVCLRESRCAFGWCACMRTASEAFWWLSPAGEYLTAVTVLACEEEQAESRPKTSVAAAALLLASDSWMPGL